MNVLQELNTTDTLEVLAHTMLMLLHWVSHRGRSASIHVFVETDRMEYCNQYSLWHSHSLK